jgi:DNA-directed RNA polymerase subunit M/transcription elongation factor TFIIS
MSDIISPFLFAPDDIKLDKLLRKYVKQLVTKNGIKDKYDIIYNSKKYQLRTNLDMLNGSLLAVDVINGKVKLEDLIEASPDVLHHEIWDPILKRRAFIKEKRNNRAGSTLYVCRICGHNVSDVYYVQTRSSDEPMTGIIRCRNCNHTFRKEI